MTVPTSELLQVAREALRNAYAPYSRFKVGCAVQSVSGRVYAGVNVENASYGLTICAERNAIFHMVAAGECRFRKLLVTADTPELVRPCGACLQVMAEFALPESRIIMAAQDGRMEEMLLSELLPLGFSFAGHEQS